VVSVTRLFGNEVELIYEAVNGINDDKGHSSLNSGYEMYIFSFCDMWTLE
jgi:hypothetical protein